MVRAIPHPLRSNAPTLYTAMLTAVLNLAATLRLMRSISRKVSSLPCRTSKSFHVCQKLAWVFGLQTCEQ